MGTFRTILKRHHTIRTVCLAFRQSKRERGRFSHGADTTRLRSRTFFGVYLSSSLRLCMALDDEVMLTVKPSYGVGSYTTFSAGRHDFGASG